MAFVVVVDVNTVATVTDGITIVSVVAGVDVRPDVIVFITVSVVVGGGGVVVVVVVVVVYKMLTSTRSSG